MQHKEEILRLLFEIYPLSELTYNECELLE